MRGSADAPTSWSVVTRGPAGLEVSVTPEAFELDPGETRKLAVSAVVRAPGLVGAWSFGAVELVPQDPGATLPVARLPLAVLPTDFVSALPTSPLLARPVPKVKLRFDRESRDRMQLKLLGWQPGVDLDPAGLELLVEVGGVRIVGTLDAKGRLRDATDRVKLRRRRDGSYQLRARRKRSSLAGQLADEGLVDETNPRPGKLVQVEVAVEAVGQRWADSVGLLYRSTAGRRGTAKSP